ncbi:hypothetical protein [Adhaeribacter pallidiroseus]|uniref:hypothetical protein n=1 Tax=Adhaeribacter pallidiroseus TaxID=2072847 RepID=UPI000E1BF2A2|nr:hypothetical protein [Adhaeribacter pallidiroseus]
MTTKKKYIFIGIIFFLTYAVIAQLWGTEKGINDFSKFNKAEIKGKIEKKVYASASGTRINIKEQEYIFHPITNKENRNKIFSYIAEVGDSILKPAYSDTLILIKKGRLLKYAFRKVGI